MKDINCQKYPIVFKSPWSRVNEIIDERRYSKIFVLVDTNTSELCLPLLHKEVNASLYTITIAAGEDHKNINTCQQIWSSLLNNGADRHSCLINLGGGVIGDMGGFCASTYMRGIDFIQVPTTLLSQVDASVGSKLGIDFMNVKNIIGVFNHPQAVLIYPGFLNTLDYRELRSGYAEVIKHALIQDPQLWKDLQQIVDLKEIDLSGIIYQNVAIKKEVVDKDPYENGLRKILNFGHTIGHAVETVFMKKSSPLLHGEAIAIGMLCEAKIAELKAMISVDHFKNIEAYIKRIYTNLPDKLEDQDKILSLMRKDKKNRDGEILASLLKGIGSCDFNISLSEEDVKLGLNYYNSIIKS